MKFINSVRNVRFLERKILDEEKFVFIKQRDSSRWISISETMKTRSNVEFLVVRKLLMVVSNEHGERLHHCSFRERRSNNKRLNLRFFVDRLYNEYKLFSFRDEFDGETQRHDKDLRLEDSKNRPSVNEDVRFCFSPKDFDRSRNLTKNRKAFRVSIRFRFQIIAKVHFNSCSSFIETTAPIFSCSIKCFCKLTFGMIPT